MIDPLTFYFIPTIFTTYFTSAKMKHGVITYFSVGTRVEFKRIGLEIRIRLIEIVSSLQNKHKIRTFLVILLIFKQHTSVIPLVFFLCTRTI